MLHACMYSLSAKYMTTVQRYKAFLADTLDIAAKYSSLRNQAVCFVRPTSEHVWNCGTMCTYHSCTGTKKLCPAMEMCVLAAGHILDVGKNSICMGKAFFL